MSKFVLGTERTDLSAPRIWQTVDRQMEIQKTAGIER